MYTHTQLTVPGPVQQLDNTQVMGACNTKKITRFKNSIKDYRYRQIELKI